MNSSADVNVPDGWIAKKSKRRANRIYYFNTVTHESQWNHPGSNAEETPTKRQTKESRNEKDSDRSFRLSNHSKQIKKHSKTPAQDRLQKLVTQLKNNPNAQKNLCNESKQVENTASQKLHTPTKSKSDTKGDGTIDQSIRNSINFTVFDSSLNENNVTATDKSDEIPSLFPPKTPSQDRLSRLRNSLNSQNEKKPPNDDTSHDAVKLFKFEFGFLSNERNVPPAAANEMEAMDWESCEVFERVEKNSCNKLVSPYVIPDTNVFLDDLSCIKETIHRADTKYNVLVPFVVLQELDKLKMRQVDQRISSLASTAIKFIYNELKSKKDRLQGQKATEDSVHLIEVTNGDDRILNCCLQLSHQSREIILITNDTNLSNKAIASDVKTMTCKEYRSKNIEL
ncbi:Transcriptional protein SWT1 [Pseudolycoriella hygida]|uniref:Transcriptional protein SWT1 n=1 Tax=Pseudolycoriella hygida TaxID=35572 RepID=A0A9Q0NEK2_9DIPT|nr:Transcriptional protein SWT1 [Pseudolycoriella hygida]